MTRNAFLTILTGLALAILGVIGHKLSPLLRPSPDLAVPVSPCNPSLEVCTVTFQDGGRLDFSIEPRPIVPLRNLILSVVVTGFKAHKVEVDFDATDERMGYNRPELEGASPRFTGQAVLPVCTSGTTQWVATVLLTAEQRQIAVPFHFAVAAR